MKDKPVILVVDDQPQNIELLEAHLVPQGYEIIKAANGEEALGKLSGNQIDLILLDVMMPGIDGFEVTRRVRQDNTHRLLPIILVTALRETEDRVKGIEAGCDDFLSKPFDKIELLARVRSLLKVKAYNDLMSNYQKELESEVTRKTEELRNSLQELDGAHQKIKVGFIETIYRLTITAEYRDEETGSHIRRIGHYSKVLAKELGLASEKAEAIFHGSPMHDLGKVAIPDNILRKPAFLTPEEFEVMKTHTTIGSIILYGSSSEYLQTAEKIALTHHEKWDGSGYPSGLKGEAIPMEGRIVNMADVYDALRSKRPYKPGLDHETAYRTIIEGDHRIRPEHFAPVVLKAFRKSAQEFARIFVENQ